MALSSRRQGLCMSPGWGWWRWGDTRVKRCVMVFPEVYNAGEKKPCEMGTGVRWIRGWEILAVPKYGQISKMWNSVAIREKVALTAFMLVSSPLTALLTTVIQRSRCGCILQVFGILSHLWITTAPVVHLQQQLLHLSIKIKWNII